jgi:hypothetical protein
MLFPHARRLVILTLVSVALLCVATPVRAQADHQLAGLLLDLLSESGRNSTTPNPANPNTDIAHAMHFIPGLSLQLAPRELNKAIGLGLTTFPLPSSAGGFAYTTDPTTGEIRLAAATFGPVYAERALTIGKRRFDFGLAFQPTSFDSFETAELGDGSMQFILEHNNCCPATNPGVTNAPDLPTGEGPDPFNPAFERDLLRSAISLDIEANTTVFYANYGLTDRFDIGAAIPIVSVQMDGAVTSTIVRTATNATPEQRRIHTFDGGQDSFTVAETRSATGLGDILLRAKYNFVRSGGNALAAAIDLRLPTGDEDDLLGTGATQTRVQLIASGEYGVFAPHASFGYTFSNGEVSDLTADVNNTVESDVPGRFEIPPPSFDPSVPDEVNYAFGFSAAAHPRLTLGFDFIGRTVRDVFRFDVGDRSLPNRDPGAVPPGTGAFPSTDELIVRGDPNNGTRQNLNLLLGVVGGKVNIGRGLLLNAGVLFPLSNSGLQPNVTPYFSFEYVF